MIFKFLTILIIFIFIVLIFLYNDLFVKYLEQIKKNYITDMSFCGNSLFINTNVSKPTFNRQCHMDTCFDYSVCQSEFKVSE